MAVFEALCLSCCSGLDCDGDCIHHQHDSNVFAIYLLEALDALHLSQLDLSNMPFRT